MIDGFDLPQIGRSPARFDFAKLDNLNGHYIRQRRRRRSAPGRAVAAHRRRTRAGRKMTPALRSMLLTAMPALKPRAKTLVELFDSTRFLWAAGRWI